MAIRRPRGGRARSRQARSEAKDGGAGVSWLARKARQRRGRNGKHRHCGERTGAPKSPAPFGQIRPERRHGPARRNRCEAATTSKRTRGAGKAAGPSVAHPPRPPRSRANTSTRPRPQSFQSDAGGGKSLDARVHEPPRHAAERLPTVPTDAIPPAVRRLPPSPERQRRGPNGPSRQTHSPSSAPRPGNGAAQVSRCAPV
jgi:hypothetical protein